jgi:S1-C subfamily serine protease
VTRHRILPIALAACACLSLLAAACSSGGHSASTPGAGSATAGASPTSTPSSVLTTEQIVQKLRPSVVRVQTESASIGAFGQASPQVGVGTGVIIDDQGHVLTNNHVVTQDSNAPANNVKVTFADGSTVPASIVGRDPATDLAVLKVDPSKHDAPPAQVGDASSLTVGEDVVAIGFALDLPGNPTVTRGVLSAKDRAIQEPQFTIDPALQTDASINPGNSGGPLVDAQGRVIGINTAAIQGAQNIGFAISVALFKPISDELIKSGDIQRGYMGIATVDVTAAMQTAFSLPVDHGVGIVQVTSGSPADSAGLRVNDIIVSVAGTTINNSGDLLHVLQQHRSGDTVDVSYYRGSNQQSTKVTLGTNPNG